MSKPTVTREMQEGLISTRRGRELGKVAYERVGDGEPVVVVTGVADFRSDKPMTRNTSNGIGSITKQFTAATLIKLWDDELSAGKKENFPDGVDTHLSHFMPGLRARFPQCTKLFDRISAEEFYEKITLRDLLNHSHGLGGRNNDKAMDLVRRDDKPIELGDIANVTEKRDFDKYGEHDYSNFGFDLAAMIVEVVAQKPFDEVVKEKVLRPHNLTSTHPQSDHLALYADSGSDVSRGYFLDHGDGYVYEVDRGEINFNTKSNTRAAGGFKSSVDDLAKFARLYMNAEMFENEEVKRAVKEYDRGVMIHKGRDADGRIIPGDEKYHLAMEYGRDRTVGHGGADCDFYADLRFNPRTGEVKNWVSVNEEPSLYVCYMVFKATNPEDMKVVEDIFNDKELREKMREAQMVFLGDEKWRRVMEEYLSDDAHARQFEALQRYTELCEEVLKIPLSDLDTTEKRSKAIGDLIAVRSKTADVAAASSFPSSPKASQLAQQQQTTDGAAR